MAGGGVRLHYRAMASDLCHKSRVRRLLHTQILTHHSHTRAQIQQPRVVETVASERLTSCSSSEILLARVKITFDNLGRKSMVALTRLLLVAFNATTPTGTSLYLNRQIPFQLLDC